MLSKEDILLVIQHNKSYFFDELGVTRIGLFGSYARGEQQPESDIDIYVEMPPNFDKLCDLWNLLEKETGFKVDLIRFGPHLRQSFLEDIQKDMIYA